MRAPPESFRPITGRPGLEREIHDLADLLRVALGKRAAEDREILRKDIDQPAVYAAVAGHEAVSRHHLLVHTEIAAAVGDQLIEFLEGAFVEQQLDALAGGELALLVLARAALRPAALLGGRVAPPQFVEAIHRHYCTSSKRPSGSR